MKRLGHVLAGTLLFLGTWGCDEVPVPETQPDIVAEDLIQHIAFLASDELGGRPAGTEYEMKAARYIAKIFKKHRLKPAGENGNYLHTFEFISDIQAGDKNWLELTLGDETVNLEMDHDFRPLSFSENGEFVGELVFAGYGIETNNGAYNDYEGLQATDKIVMVLRYTPEGNNPHSSFYSYAALRRKAMVAREKGARAILFVTGPEDGEDELIRLRYDGTASRSGIAAVSISRATAERILAFAGKDLQTVQKQINEHKKPVSFPIPGVQARIRVDLQEVRRQGHNVAGLLEGSDPAVRHELIILGAHFDHLGLGGRTSLAPDAYGQVHNGADDNASGTAGLLELVEAFATSATKPRRSLLFLAFSAEEYGLLGSRAYVERPGVPLDHAITMINMDMIGRMRNNRLIVHGIGTSPIWKSVLDSLNQDPAFGFELKLNKEGVGPSDHSTFYQKGMPVLFFFTGLHDDYHRPTDDFDKIAKDDEARIVNYIAAVVRYLDRLPAKPRFTKVETPQRRRTGRGFRVYLGTIPDYAETDVEGMKLSGVRKGGPAERAGLQAGDIIIKFGKHEIKNVYDYTYALQDARPGEEVDIVVLRNGQKLTFHLKLEGKR